MDLIVRNGFMAEKRERMDIGIVGGKIVRVSSKIKESGRRDRCRRGPYLSWIR